MRKKFIHKTESSQAEIEERTQNGLQKSNSKNELIQNLNSEN